MLETALGGCDVVSEGVGGVTATGCASGGVGTVADGGLGMLIGVLILFIANIAPHIPSPISTTAVTPIPANIAALRDPPAGAAGRGGGAISSGIGGGASFETAAACASLNPDDAGGGCTG